MKIKLFFLFFTFIFINYQAQEYIFGKIKTEENVGLSDVIVLNLRTDHQELSNNDGHFMIEGKKGDLIRFIKVGYERLDKNINQKDIETPIDIILQRKTALIAEVELKRNLTGDLKSDSKIYNEPQKVKKLKEGLNQYIHQKSDPRLLAAKPGEFVQPKGQGFVIGAVKNKWDDIDFTDYLRYALGDQYFKDLKIEPVQINHFINYVLAGGFERKNILKYGYCSDVDLMRFQRAVLAKIPSYKSPQTK